MPDGHAMPQPPQLARLLLVLTQFPSQQVALCFPQAPLLGPHWTRFPQLSVTSPHSRLRHGLAAGTQSTQTPLLSQVWGAVHSVQGSPFLPQKLLLFAVLQVSSGAQHPLTAPHNALVQRQTPLPSQVWPASQSVSEQHVAAGEARVGSQPSQQPPAWAHAVASQTHCPSWHTSPGSHAGSHSSDVNAALAVAAAGSLPVSQNPLSQQPPSHTRAEAVRRRCCTKQTRSAGSQAAVLARSRRGCAVGVHAALAACEVTLQPEPPVLQQMPSVHGSRSSTST